MKIVRNGMEFHLTPQELLQAYTEQEHIYDIRNIHDNMEHYLDPLLFTRLKENEEFIEAAADALRRNQDHYDMGYDAALRTSFDETIEDFLLPVNLVTIIRERLSEHEVWSDDFWVDASKTPSKEIFQEAVEAFLLTNAGQRAVDDTCNDFNWGDAMIYVPDDVWAQFGIYFVDYAASPKEIGVVPSSDMNLYKIQVDQDELLIPTDYRDRLNASHTKEAPISERIQSAVDRAAGASAAEQAPTKDHTPER